MADGFGLREKLDARIGSARRTLLLPAIIRAIGPVALWIAAFAVIWLSGLAQQLPLESRAVLGLIFWLGLAATAWFSFKRWKRPTDSEARNLIDEQVEGRPLSVWVDRPSRSDTQTWKLWSAHRDRMAALAVDVRKFRMGERWKKIDPLYLRFIAPVLVLAAALFAGANGMDRLRAGMAPDFGAMFGAHKLTVEAWITPPTYTGRAPFLLTSGESATAPEGSEMTLRVISPGRPNIRVVPEEGKRATLRPKAGVDEAYEVKINVDTPMRVAVNFWGERAYFPFDIIEDFAPTVEFVSPPTLGDGDRTEFDWKVSDDYGVTQLELIARLAEPPAGAEDLEESVPMSLIGFEPREEEGSYSEDLVRHRWAGLNVMVKLRATDASGEYGESEEVAYHLPEKIFLQPFARSAQEVRASILREWRDYEEAPPEDNYAQIDSAGDDNFADAEASRLTRAPPGVKDAAAMLEAILYQPEDTHRDPIIFMAFSHVEGQLQAAYSLETAMNSETLLWDIALSAEYGSVADAKAALDAARRALEQALRNGASEEEIKRLMDMFEQAVENYLAAQMAEAMRNGRVTQGQAQAGGQPGQQSLGDDELQRMLDALRDLSETGATEQARQLLSEMSRMLEQFENMQLQMSQGGGGQQQEGPLSRALNRALQDTNRALNDQRDLNDETEQAMREGGDAQTMQDLADRQRALRERLEQQMRSGGGQPQQGEQGQGQQGQQGEGQQPGGGSEQGEGGQGEQPGQGQNGRTQQGQRDGGGGSPGVETGDQFGQENARSRRLLADALDAQRRSEEALRRGDLEAARDAQAEAMSSLQARSGELTRLAENADPGRENERDILGRLTDGDSGYSDTVEVPDEIERQRARDILDEIRRRAGDRTLSREEQEYLRRLLDRF